MSASISWDDQRVFLAVIEGGSLSAAGRTLGLAQPTVRARLEALEHALGCTLFIRSSQGLLPTDQARTLHGHVRAMDHASRTFLRAASAPPGRAGYEVQGTVRISVAEVVGIEVLPPMLVGLRARYPRLAIEVDLSNDAANLAELAADVAVRMVAPRQDTLVARKVGDIALGFFAHRDYVARRGSPVALEDLGTHDFIGPDRSALDRRVLGESLPADVAARMLVRTDSHPAALAFARAGLGIAVAHRALGHADPRLVEVLPDIAPRLLPLLPVWMVAHKDLRQEPRVRVAFDHLAEALAAYCQQ